MVETGTILAAATCHQRGTFASTRPAIIKEKFNELERRLAGESIPLRVVPNAEWLLDASTTEHLDELIPELVTIADAGKYALVEFPFPYPSYAPLIPEILAKHGIRPMLSACRTIRDHRPQPISRGRPHQTRVRHSDECGLDRQHQPTRDGGIMPSAHSARPRPRHCQRYPFTRSPPPSTKRGV